MYWDGNQQQMQEDNKLFFIYRAEDLKKFIDHFYFIEINWFFMLD